MPSNYFSKRKPLIFRPPVCRSDQLTGLRAPSHGGGGEPCNPITNLQLSADPDPFFIQTTLTVTWDPGAPPNADSVRLTVTHPDCVIVDGDNPDTVANSGSHDFSLLNNLGGT